ncbi:MAG: DUF2029 domain-containing protein [bacterium]|nr:DUF2029 domain-containing protein [bacterium]
MKVGFERKVIAFSIVTTVGVILIHALSMMLRKTWVPDAIPAAHEFVFAATAAMLVSLGLSLRWSGLIPQIIGALSSSTAAAVVLALAVDSLQSAVLAVPIVCLPAALIAHRMSERLPVWLDGTYQRFPVRSILWALLMLITVTQTSRLSSWVTDSNEEWMITTDHPLFAGHLCMTAYIYAADLNRQGVANIYDRDHYPGMNPEAVVNTSIANLNPEDPYQYPPQFLLLPRLAIALTDDFEVIKIFWLLVQALFFGFLAWSVARFIGGEVGLRAALLIPLLWISFPVLSNLQYGQFHLMSILLAVAAMMWFARGKMHIGGAALAFAVLSKAAPGILLIYLLARRRWRELGWTLAYVAAFSFLALAIIGPQPFEAFFAYQLPSLQDGSAFAFDAVWPELRNLIIAGNQSPFAFIQKLDALGIPGMTASLAKFTHLFYTLVVVAFAFIASRIEGDRHRQLLIWLALLNLAAMISKGAWGDYIPIGTIWLMTFMVKDMWSTVRQRVLMAVMWVFMFLSLGVLPLPGLDNPTVFISLAGIGMLLTIGFNMWIIYRRPAEIPAEPTAQ